LHILQKDGAIVKRPQKEQPKRTKRDFGKGKQVNTVKVRKNKLPARSKESLSSSSDEEKLQTKTTRAAREHQVTQVTDSGTGTGLLYHSIHSRDQKR